MAHPTELVDSLEALFASKRIRRGVGYTRAELVEIWALACGAEQAAELFAQLRRQLATGGSLAEDLHVSALPRAGGPCRYCFDADARAPEPSHEAGAVDIHLGDNLELLPRFESGSFALIYTDPPFNTGRDQARTQIKATRDEAGDRRGFGGQRYRTEVLGTRAFADSFDDYLEFLAPRLEQAHRLLADEGSLLLHLDYREVHYAKVLLDQIFGREAFINEIIWSYDYGGRSKSRWSAKHDNILWYAKDPARYCFNFDEIDRIPYMAPRLVGAEKAARGKTPTDVWWHTIVSPTGREKTGYPTQKPLGILRRIVRVHSRPGDHLLDMFAGSGSLGEAGAELGRRVTLIDQNPEALAVMRARLERFSPTIHTQTVAGEAGPTDPG